MGWRKKRRYERVHTRWYSLHVDDLDAPRQTVYSVLYQRNLKPTAIYRPHSQHI